MGGSFEGVRGLESLRALFAPVSTKIFKVGEVRFPELEPDSEVSMLRPLVRGVSGGVSMSIWDCEKGEDTLL